MNSSSSSRNYSGGTIIPGPVAIGEQNAKLDAYIARILADAPPLSEARLDKIASLLRSGTRTNNDTSREAS